MKALLLVVVFVAVFAVTVDAHAYLISPAPRVAIEYPGWKVLDDTTTWTKYNSAAGVQACSSTLKTGSGLTPFASAPKALRGTWSVGQPITVKWYTSIWHPSDPGVEVWLKCGTAAYTRKITGETIGTETQLTKSVTFTPDAACANGILLWSWRSAADGGYYMDCADIVIQAAAGATGLILPEPAYPGSTPAPGPTPATGDSSSVPEDEDPVTEPAKKDPLPGDISLKIMVEADLESYGAAEFEADAAADLALVININSERITINRLKQMADMVEVTFSISNQSPYPKLTVKTVQTRINKGDFSAAAALSGIDVTTTADVTGQVTSGTKNGSSSSGGNTAAIAGAVCGVLVVIGAGAGYWWYRKTHTKTASSNFNNIAPVSSVVITTPSAPMSPNPAAAAAGWTKVWDDNTKHYYFFNTNTSESSWTPPPGCENL